MKLVQIIQEKEETTYHQTSKTKYNFVEATTETRITDLLHTCTQAGGFKAKRKKKADQMPTPWAIWPKSWEISQFSEHTSSACWTENYGKQAQKNIEEKRTIQWYYSDIENPITRLYCESIELQVFSQYFESSCNNPNAFPANNACVHPFGLYFSHIWPSLYSYCYYLSCMDPADEQKVAMRCSKMFFSLDRVRWC